MANSLSDWLADKVASSIASHGGEIGPNQQDRQSLLGDIAFEKGLGVQILHFFTPQVARQAHGDLLLSYHGGSKSQQPTQIYDSNPVRDAAGSSKEDAEPLCAIVADKTHRVHVQFSRHCVARFNSTYARPLITLRGSLIQIKSFRPSISFLPSFLGKTYHGGGPFTESTNSIRPVLYLEIESMHVLGSINEVQFWNDKELEKTLLSKDTPSTPFKVWFKQVEKMMMKVHNGKRRRVGETTSTQTNKRKYAKSSSGSDDVMAPASMPMPPPFQRPIEMQKSSKQQDTSQGSGSIVSSKSKREVSQTPWGGFTLSQGDDEFGLEAAASQLIERHEQGLDSFEGQLTSDSLDTIYPLLQREDHMLNNSGISLDDASRSSRLDSNSSQESRENLSQISTLPATLPTTSHLPEDVAPLASNILQASNNLNPPSKTDSTFLPFSLGVASKESTETSAGGLQIDPSLPIGQSIQEQEKSTSILPPTPPIPQSKRKISKVKRDSAIQTKDTSLREVGITTNSVEQERFDLRLRAPSEEVARERDKNFLSSTDILID